MNALAELRKQPHLSASAINTFMRCPLQYRFRYVDHLPDPTISSALIFGTAFDRTIERFFESFLHEGIRLSAEELGAIFDAQQLHALETSSRDITYKPGEDAETLLDTGHKLCAVMANEVDPSSIIGTKQTFSLNLPGVELPIIGEMDAAENDAIIEVKTACRKYAQNQIDDLLQAQLYALYRQMEESDEEETLVKILVFTKTKTPEFQICYASIDRATTARTASLIQTVNSAITAQNFYPNPNFLCGGCPYKQSCASWS